MADVKYTIEDLEPEYDAVVATDFGTANSGFMFSLKNFPKNVKRPATEIHVPTIILLTPKKEFHSFGEAARSHMLSLSKEEAQKWFYFERFKMELHATKNLSDETWIKARNEKEMKAIDVFSLALAYFKETAERAIGRFCFGMENQKIKWVLTVPAIWTQRARQFMRKAAYQAGLASPDEPKRIVIALEPEVASLYVRTSPPPSKQSSASEKKTISLRDPYLIADCGGGTVDCTVHEPRDDGYLVEKCLPSGGPWGSLRVDENFEKLLGNILGFDVIREIKISVPADWSDVMRKFEMEKMKATTDDDQSFCVRLPKDLQQVHADFGDGETIETKLDNYNENHAEESEKITLHREGTLMFKAPTMRKLIDPVIDRIVEHIAELLTLGELETVRSLIVVGGFANSVILQETLKRRFADRVEVVVPKDPSVAVLYGAVLFGHNMRAIAERRSAYTYGVSKLEKLPENEVEADRKFRHNVFDTFVRVNVPVGVDDVVRRRYQTCDPGQLRVTFGVYRSKREKVEYTTDEGVESCGRIEIKLRSRRSDGHGFVDVAMKFGRTEIEVTAKDLGATQGGRCKVELLMI